MEGGGFFGGLAEGFNTGFDQARRARQQNFEDQLQAMAEQRTDADFDLQQHQHKLAAFNDFADDIQREAATDPDINEPDRRAYYARAQEMISNGRRNQYAAMGLPFIQKWQADSTKVANDLHRSDAGLHDVPPDKLSAAITYHVGHDAQDLTPQSDVVQAAQTVTQAAQSGKYDQAIPALNQLYATDLGTYIGKPAYDGSTISGPPRIIAMHPNPKDPTQSTFVANFNTVNPDGRAGTFQRPLMLNGDHLSLHPEDAGDKPVLSMDTNDFIHHTLGLATTILATQHPDVQAQLQQASPEQSDKNKFLLDLSTRLGTKSTYVTQSHYEFGKDGSLYEFAPTGGVSRVFTPTRHGLQEIEDNLSDAIESGDEEGQKKWGQALATVKGWSGLRDPNAAADAREQGLTIREAQLKLQEQALELRRQQDEWARNHGDQSEANAHVQIETDPLTFQPMHVYRGKDGKVHREPVVDGPDAGAPPDATGGTQPAGLQPPDAEQPPTHTANDPIINPATGKPWWEK